MLANSYYIRNRRLAYNLALLKRLLHLLQVSQVTNVTADALGSRTKGANGIGNTKINLSKLG